MRGAATALVVGVLGWRNADDPPNGTSFAVYGPGGRWDRTRGLEDELVANAATEGDTLIVLAVARYADAELYRAAIERAVAEIEATAEPGGSQP